MNESIINEAENYRRLKKKIKIMKIHDGKDELSVTNEINRENNENE